MGGKIYDMVCKAYYFIELQVFVPRWKLPTTQKEPQKSRQTWNAKAWDSYTYRAKAPRLPQFDRDASSRTRAGIKSIEQFDMGPRRDNEKAIGVVKNARGAHENEPIRGKRKISPERNDSSGKPQKALSEEKIPRKL